MRRHLERTVAAVVPLMEIPSWILADRWSRRGVLMLAAGAALVSAVVGGLSQNVGVQMTGWITVGLVALTGLSLVRATRLARRPGSQRTTS